MKAGLKVHDGAEHELLILRHAKSDWEHGVESDFDRPLAPRGRKDAPRIGAWLREEGLWPDVVLCSPALRARETAQAVCDALQDGEQRRAVAVRFESGIYEGSRDTLLAALDKLRPGTHRVLLIGHNPGLDSLLVHLCGHELPYTGDGKLLTTAAVARVVLPGDWHRLPAGSGRLLSLVRPRDLVEPAT